MSEPRGRPPCACTNISLMQLFHELKQKFPAVPDHVVSDTIELYCHDKSACETHLHGQAEAALAHAYHASSSAAARRSRLHHLHSLEVAAPLHCRNRPLVTLDGPTATLAPAVPCPQPQNALLSTSDDTSSPVINLDNCEPKYCSDSQSDAEAVNEVLKDINSNEKPCNDRIEDVPIDSNFKIHKSDKIKFNLHEKLEKGKEKRTISKKAEVPVDKENLPSGSEVSKDKPKRPNTLEFLKPKPDIAFKENLQQPEVEQCQSVSPITADKPDHHNKENNPASSSFWQERGYPLNLSVNVNCHMDLGRNYQDPWLEEFDNPRAITSLNLTVCTPTSSMASPVRERRDEDGGYESHFTVTVSPSSMRPPPRRRAPPPPPSEPSLVSDRSLIERQRARLAALEAALTQERERLRSLARETEVLAAPTDPARTGRLRDDVQRLRKDCDALVKRMEGNASGEGGFYSNIYTGQRPAPSRAAPPPPGPPPGPPAGPPPAAPWQCHMCTFRNHPLLDKCEECEMPRILVGTSTSSADSGFGSLRIRDVPQTLADVRDVVEQRSTVA